MMKKGLSILLVIILLFTAIPVGTLNVSAASSGTCGENLTWTCSIDSGVLTIRGTGEMDNWGIEGSEPPWESYRSYIKTIIIDDGITTIGDYAFETYYVLENVVVPDSVITIGNSAFESCNALEKLIIPDSVITIGDSAFESCDALKNIVIPDSVITFGPSVFKDCVGLTEVAIPKNITTISEDAFRGCTGLKNAIIPNGVTTICRYAFYGCTGLTNVVIPNSVTTIEDWSFIGCISLTNVTIPGSVTTMGSKIFGDCTGLRSIKISEGVSEIGYLMFYGCSNLSDFTIPSSVTDIGSSAFEYCNSLTSVTIPENVKKIGSGALRNCSNLTSINVDSNNLDYASIDGMLFDRDITNLICCPAGISGYAVIPSTVTKIESTAFYGCNKLVHIDITADNSYFEVVDDLVYDETIKVLICCPEGKTGNVYIPDTVTNIPVNLLGNCQKISSINVDENNQNYTSIDGLLYDKNVDNLILCPRGKTGDVIIEKTVTKIGENAFNDCNVMNSVTFPDGVSSLWGNTLKNTTIYGGRGFYSFEVNDGKAVIKYSSYMLQGATLNNCTIVLPDSYDGYPVKEITYGFYFYDGISSYNLVIPMGVEKIGNNAFCYDRHLKNVNIPNSVVDIGDYAFFYCSLLESTTIPNSVTNIGAGAFTNCSSLKSITIPDSVTSISESAFSYCSSLESITIPDTVTNIGASAFMGCSSLKNITIPDSVTNIGVGAFTSCSSLKSITIPDTVTNIGAGAFTNCSSLEAITLSDTVTSIEQRTFQNCTSLSKVKLPSSLATIGTQVFDRCVSLETITIPGSVTSIADSAFDGAKNLKAINVDNSNSNYASIEGVLYNKTISKLIYYPQGKAGNIFFPSTLTTIGYRAFDNWDRLISIIIPSTVTSIERSAFYRCKKLTSVTIPASVRSIGESAFLYCDKLTDVYYLGTAEEWATISIGSGNSCLTNATIHCYKKTEVEGGTDSTNDNDNTATEYVPLSPLNRTTVNNMINFIFPFPDRDQYFPISEYRTLLSGGYSNQPELENAIKLSFINDVDIALSAQAKLGSRRTNLAIEILEWQLDNSGGMMSPFLSEAGTVYKVISLKEKVSNFAKEPSVRQGLEITKSSLQVAVDFLSSAGATAAQAYSKMKSVSTNFMNYSTLCLNTVMGLGGAIQKSEANYLLSYIDNCVNYSGWGEGDTICDLINSVNLLGGAGGSFSGIEFIGSKGDKETIDGYGDYIANMILGMKNTPSKTTKYEAHCPVVMEVYDAEDNLVITIGNDDVGSLYTSIGNFYCYKEEGTDDYVKVAILYSDEYYVKIVGVSEGSMDFKKTIETEEGEVIQCTIDDIPVNASTIFSENRVDDEFVLANESSTVYIADSDIDVTQQIKYSITIQCSEGGMALGDEVVNEYSNVIINAYPNAGYTFEGWYDDSGNKISSSEEYSFVISSDQIFVAKFVMMPFTRIYGNSRYQTSVAISDKGWESADTVILANGTNYADALAGVPLAYKLDAPILLTAGKAQLEADIVTQIEKLNPSKIIILGGKGAISEDIESALSENYTVERIYGASRYDTAVEISKHVSENPEEVFVVTGTGYADALSISPYAAMKGIPIVYSNPVIGLSENTANYLANTPNITAIGGEGAVPVLVETQLEDKNFNRIYGQSRYLTSYQIVDTFKEEFGNDVMFATGTNFPDALAGGVLGAKLQTPLLLTHPNGVIDEIKNYVISRNPQNVYILGGEGAVPTSIIDEIFK